MKSVFRRGAVALLTIGGAVLVATVEVTPQAQTPPAGAQMTPPAPGGGQTPPGGRGPGGRGGLGGPGENDPANATADYGAKPPIKILTPEEEQKKIWLPPGFKLEPVLTDPD